MTFPRNAALLSLALISQMILLPVAQAADPSAFTHYSVEARNARILMKNRFEQMSHEKRQKWVAKQLRRVTKLEAKMNRLGEQRFHQRVEGLVKFLKASAPLPKGDVKEMGDEELTFESVTEQDEVGGAVAATVAQVSNPRLIDGADAERSVRQGLQFTAIQKRLAESRVALEKLSANLQAKNQSERPSGFWAKLGDQLIPSAHAELDGLEVAVGVVILTVVVLALVIGSSAILPACLIGLLALGLFQMVYCEWLGNGC